MNFAKILESKMRQEIRKDFLSSQGPQESQTSSEPLIRSELWTELVGKISPRHFSTSQNSKAYHQFRRPPQPRPDHILSPEQILALQFFISHGSEIAANYTTKELKLAFRKLALKLHPDQGGQTEAFLALKKAFECLHRVVS